MEYKDVHLKEMTVDNFKSLKKSTVTFKNGLNIIIGKNGAGKSNLLEFIYNYTGYNSLVNPRSLSACHVMIHYQQNDETVNFSYEIEKSKTPHFSPVNDSRNYEIYYKKVSNSIIVFQDIKPHKSPSFLNNELLFEPDLENDANVLRLLETRKSYLEFILPQEINWLSKAARITIDGEHNFTVEQPSSFLFFSQLEISVVFRRAFDNGEKTAKGIKSVFFDFLNQYIENTYVNNYLNQYSPISEIRFNPNINIYQAEEVVIVENLIIDFKVNGDWVPWSYLSDGTKRLFYLISETISLKEGLLLIEEPELGVHPHQLHHILDFLKEQSRNKQIIISTHSPLSLDVLNEDELDRIIIAKYEKGSRFNHLTQDQIDTAKRYMKEVGELSYYWLHSDLDV